MASKRPFSMDYKQYDTSEGFGTPKQWRAAFRSTMNLDEARVILGDESPHGILGLAVSALWSEVKTAYRKLSMACHPDRCAIHGLTEAAATAAFKRLTAAYVILEGRYQH